MLKIKKILILATFMILFTGCDVEYNLVIDNKKRVIEEATFLQDNDNMLKYSSTIDEFIYDREQENFLDSSYQYERIYEGDKSGLNVKNSYKSLEDYVNSRIYKRLFEDAKIISDKKFYSFTTFGDYYRNSVFSTPLEATYRYNIDKITVNIKFYNVVDSHNADKVDEKNNVYTWYLESSNLNEQIKFTLSNEVRTDIVMQNFFSKYKIVIIVCLLVIVLSIYGILKFMSIRKENNKI